jgi:hypothetical protein
MARATVLSALVYTTASLAAGGVFLAITLSTGDYGWVARLGGSGWVSFLSMIILMPVVIPWMKARTGA